jgi:replicative DNA helicase Mcm
MQNINEQIENFKGFIEQYYEKKLHEINSKGISFVYIDFFEIAEFSPELAEILLENPEDALKILYLAISEFEVNIKPRIFNLPKSQFLDIRNIRSKDLDKFVYIEGIVRQASDVRPQVTSAKFECPTCGNNISILQLDTKFKEPSRCSCGNRNRFRLLSKELVDAQRLVIEESPENLEGGEQSKRLPVYLKEDLVEPKMEKRTTPGSKVRINGIIKEIPIFLSAGAKSINYDLSMDANSIIPIEETFEEIEISKEEEEEIKNLAKDPLVYEKLTNSIAPSIYGHEKIKEAIILQLMSGVRKVKDDGTVIRGDMHILLVGDPGAAKSSILEFVSKSAPKARFISGKSSSSAGITASVVKDEFIRGWALEAGALVLANGGLAAIDEFDKMSTEDRSAMHESMEQQRVSISKANIQATLRTQTSILAAANPKFGRFDPYSSIASQIDLPPTLINRFDLIFPVRDIPNKERDERIASHVLELQKKSGKIESEIPNKLLRKYIAYAKQNIKPILTDGAVEEIKRFYVNLRNKGQSSGEEIQTIPISARQLEALVRLSEASAKVRLSKKVTRADSKRAIEILTYCLTQVGIDPETGKIDIDRISTGITATQRSRIVVIRELIRELEAKHGKSIPIEVVIEEAKKKGYSEDQIDDAIEKLKREAEIFSPKQNFVSRL